MKELRKKKKARLAAEKENAAKLNDTKEDLLRQLAAINEQQEAEALRIKQEKKAKKVAKTERKAAKAAKEEHDAEVAAEVARNAEAEAAKKEAKQAEVRRAHQAAKERAQRQKASKHKKEQKKRRHARGGGKEGGGVVPETPPQHRQRLIRPVPVEGQTVERVAKVMALCPQGAKVSGRKMGGKVAAMAQMWRNWTMTGAAVTSASLKARCQG